MYYGKMQRRGAHVPDNKSGHLYYVRLKTEAGTFYKIGFTSMNSVVARMAYKGEGHEKLIDKILLFHYFDDGFSVEQRFHQALRSQRMFDQFSAVSYLPLAGNGQSELYAEDVLRLDPEFTQEQSESTRQTVRLLHELHNPCANKTRARRVLEASLLFIVFLLSLVIVIAFHVSSSVIGLFKPEWRPKIGILEVVRVMWISEKGEFFGVDVAVEPRPVQTLDPDLEAVLRMVQEKSPHGTRRVTECPAGQSKTSDCGR